MFPGKDRRMNNRRYRSMRDEVMRRRRSITVTEQQHFVSQYDGAIAYMDSQLERLAARLKELGTYDNTLIVVVSDHGEAFGEHDVVGHGQTLYQHQVLVPLLIKYPGQRTAQTINNLVGHVDLLPTVLDALELEIPSGLHGRSLLRLHPNDSRQVISEEYPFEGHVSHTPAYPPLQWAAFSKNVKVIAASTGAIEVYEPWSDRLERRNMAASGSDLGDDLQAKLNQWLESVPLQVPPIYEADARTLERLRALGYMK
jgi:arylsulfatase A-like enzyme